MDPTPSRVEMPEAVTVALTLPQEVTDNIFKRLDMEDLLAASSTCRCWFGLATDFRKGWLEEVEETKGYFVPD
ncbi:hypothetical protein CYMTET_44407 [Cymbomonas tetramitiformis]|uniref:F-box domain-containing protein n=1 Tax=Cymbomonas tetramitiformis TaxID=36881 RepID=A0AAE0C0A1_9CHLO|nr:hypothetical protein CYMTET_44407 [Cymbomonas tetramitiformis]